MQQLCRLLRLLEQVSQCGRRGSTGSTQEIVLQRRIDRQHFGLDENLLVGLCSHWIRIGPLHGW